MTFDANGVTTNINVSGLLYPQSITVNDSRNYLLGGSGKISGSAALTKNGSGQLSITNTGGNDFTGPITVNAGILKITRADALGGTNGTTTIASGAMLDLAGTGANSPGETVIISGSGITNGGAIINTGADQNNGLRYVSLAADASIGNYPGRWDIRGSGGNSSFSGGLFLNGYTLTKMGSGKNEFADVICTNGGSLINAGGTLAFTRSLIDGPGTVTILGTNVLQLENCSTGSVVKPVVFSGNGTLQAVGSAFMLASPITNLAPGSLTVDTPVNLSLAGIMSGSGGVTKTSVGSLIMQAPDLCAGPITVNAGALVLTNTASLPNISSLTLATNTVLDVTGTGGLTLGATQTLAGSGTLNGSINTIPGTTLIPGGNPGIGTLTFNNDLALNGTTNLLDLGAEATVIGDGGNDLLVVGHDLNLSGLNTLQIAPLAALDTSTPYTVLTYSNALIGNLANLTALSPNPRYTFTVLDPATTPNAIKVAVSGIPVSLLWQGGQAGNPTLWDTGVTRNWLDSGSADVFYPGDSVTFDDTGSMNQVTVASTVRPATMTVNNSAVNYTLSGQGAVSAGSLVKQGSGTFSFANSGTNSFTLGITLNAGTLNFSPAADQALAAVVSDDGSGLGTLQKQGTNLLALTGNNVNFNGSILVGAGTLKPGNTNALGSINGGTTVANGATLDINGLNLGTEPITASGNGVAGKGAIYNGGANQQNALRSVTLAGDTTFGGTARWDLRSDAIGFASLNTSPAGSPYKLTKVGTNQFSLVGAVVDGFLGNVEVQQGTFSVETSTFNMGNVLGDPTYTLTVFTNATLQLYNLNNALNKQIAMQDGALINNGAGNNYIAGNIALTGSNVFNVTTGSLTVNNPVTGGGAPYKLGANTLSLMLNNNFGGGLFVNGGTANLYSDNSFSGPVTVNTGNLAIDSSSSLTASKNVMVSTSTGGGGATGSRITLGITYGGSWTVPPGVSVNLPSSQPGDLRSILYANKGYSEWQGPITFYAQAGAATPGSVAMSSDASNSVFVIGGPMSGVLTNLILRGNNTGVGKVYGPINVSNPGGLPPRLEKTEVSLWTLYNNNNVWGDTIIHNGVLQLGINNPCPVGGFLTIGENVAVSTLDLNGYNQQFSGLASAGNGITPSGANTNDFIGNSSTTTDSTFTLLGTNVTVFEGSIIDQAVFYAPTNLFGSRRVGLTLAAGNTGSLTLSGPNTYTGPTLLNGGTLLVNGSLGNTIVTVNNGATLGGTGLLSGPVSINIGGALALGPAIGTLTLSNNLTLSGSTCVAKVNPDLAINDLVQGVGTVTYGGTLVVTNVGTTSLAGGASLRLFDASAYAGSFASIVPAQPGLGLGWDTSSLAINGTLKVVTTVNTTPTNLAAVVHGNQLTLSWPADHIGWRVQTNAVNVANTNFWFTLPGSTTTNQVVLPIDQTRTNVFYRMTYP